jgi:DNA-binding transcriptional LysR family regulator
MAANLQHLRAFHAIATEGGVSRAARRLNLSQPTLSQQLKALEARHGVTLFESRKTPLHLSAAGRDLFALTQKMFGVVGEIDELLGESIRPEGGLLRLGSDSPLYSAHLVALFLQRYPNAEVQVCAGNAREVLGWLGDAQIDATIASDPDGDARFHYVPLATDNLFCAVPTGHSFAGEKSILIERLRGETLIMRERTSKTRALGERAMRDIDVAPGKVIEMQGREGIREALALGLGISLVATAECTPDSRLAYIPIDTGSRKYEMTSYLVIQSERRNMPIMRAIQLIAKSMAQNVD